MKINSIMNDEKFNYFFSFILGVGLICLLRPICSGKDCHVSKPPLEKDFDKFVYRLAEKCYEFKTKIVKCPETGAIEAFRTCSSDAFQRRASPIPRM